MYIRRDRGFVLLVIGLILLALCSCQGHSYIPDSGMQAISDHGVKHFGKCEVQYVDNIPILKLRGNPYEMGLQYGTLMRSEMQCFVYDMDEFMDGVIASMPWYARILAPVMIKSYARGIKGRLPEYYQEEIRGMSDGSGIPLDKLVFIASGGGFMDTSGCTSILVRLGDRVIHGRNFDWAPPMLARYPIVAEYHPEGKKSFTNFSFIGYPGVIHGINQDGLSLTTNIAFGMYNDSKENNGLPITFKNREVLERASTLNGAGEIIRRYKTDEPGWMITVESSSEKSGTIFEMYDNHITEIPLKGRYEFVHNVLFRPDRLDSTELSRKYLNTWLGETEWNVARINTTSNFLKTRGINNIDDMLAYLSDTGFYQYDDMILTDNSSINNEYTFNTLVFDAMNSAVYYAVSPGYSGLARMYRYDMKKGTMSLYRKADPILRDPEFKRKMAWFNRYKSLDYRGEYKKILEQTDFSSDLSPAQLKAVKDVWEKAPDALDPQILITKIDQKTARYPDYGMLYMIKGDILHSSNKDRDAILSYNRALSSNILSLEYRLRILGDLPDLYLDNGEGEKARAAMLEYIKLVDELEDRYHMEASVRKRYNEMKKIVSPQGR